MSTCTVEYEIGDQPEITATFRNSAKVLVTPSGVRFVVQRDKPGAPQTTYTQANAEVTNPSTGVWLLTLPTVTVSGTYNVHVYGTGGIIAGEQGSFVVAKDLIH